MGETIKTMTQRSFDNAKVNPRALLKLYKIFKSRPKKVFVISDFLVQYGMGNVRHNLEINLKILAKLNIIEIVDAEYKCGGRYQVCRTANGYKLKVIKCKEYKQ